MASKEFKVRLSRTSSAQAVLKKETRERKKSTQPKLDSMIDEEKSTDTVTGKLPVEAAYVVMKRVTEEVGQPLNAAGRSTFNKLQSLKTTPAVDLLLQKTWREFFTKKTNQHSALAGVKSGVESGSALPDQGVERASAEDLVRRQKEMKQQISSTFDRLVRRVESLWKALKIPSADQVFYRKTLCKGPPQSLEQCREVAHYILALKNHQEATVAVIQAIQIRELTIARCFDVLAALQRKFSRSLHSREAAGNAGTLSATFTPLAAGGLLGTGNGGRFSFTGSDIATGRPESAGERDGTGGFWKEELICALEEVRATTLEVIKRVQRWRRNMWRPHPFVYMGVNYVAKMRDDLSILESDLYGRLLALVPLRYADLQCVVFLSGANKIFVDSTTANNSASASNGPSAPRSGASSPFPSRQTSAHPLQQTLPPTHPSYPAEPNPRIDQLLHEFRSRYSARELQLAATVVLEEEVLQNALSIEQASLLQKGVFIPTLHFKRDEKGVVSRSASQTSNLVLPTFYRHGEGHTAAAHPQDEEASHPSQEAQGTGSVPPHYSIISYGDEPQQHQPFNRPHPQQQLYSSQQGAVSHPLDKHGGAAQEVGEEEVDWAPDFAG